MSNSEVPPHRVRAQVTIMGDVQGVSFRAWMLRQALSNGLTGWVRNRADGSVEALIEGDKQQVHRLVESAHSGPAYAEVKNVSVSWEPYAGEFGSFTIR